MSFILFLSQIALADDFDDAINRAKAALIDEKYTEVTKELKSAKKSVGKTNRVIPREEFVQLHFLEALAQFKQGKSDEAIPHLRKALISYPRLEFKNDITSDPAHFELFLSVQSEVSYRQEVDAYIPESYGTAEIYIDGALRTTGDKVRLGEHLAQIKCPKGEVFTKWTEFKGSYNWIKMCPYKFDLRKPCPEPNDDPLALNPFEEVPAHCVEGAENPLTKPEEGTANPLEESITPQLWTKINKPLLIGSVLSAAAAGTLYYLALQERKSFDNLGTGAITNEDELRSLQSDINTKVFISAGLGVATVGFYAGALWKVRF